MTVKWLYPLLLATESAGVALIYWHGLPAYRKVAANSGIGTPQIDSRAVAIIGSALVQFAYWNAYRLRLSAVRVVHNALLGHIVLLFARLSFLLATGVFSFLYIARNLAGHLTFFQHIILLLSLFSLFCYMLELQRLGNMIMGPRKETDSAD